MPPVRSSSEKQFHCDFNLLCSSSLLFVIKLLLFLPFSLHFLFFFFSRLVLLLLVLVIFLMSFIFCFVMLLFVYSFRFSLRKNSHSQGVTTSEFWEDGRKIYFQTWSSSTSDIFYLDIYLSAHWSNGVLTQLSRTFEISFPEFQWH